MRVILLAHYDDEIFLLPYIYDQNPKLIIYLTSGVSNLSNNYELELRTQESFRIFKKYLKVRNCMVLYLGRAKCIPEGELFRYISREYIESIAAAILSQCKSVTEIITTTFEGAHQDHDAAACIARNLAKRFNIIPIEVASYPQKFSRIYSFQVLKPKFESIKQVKYQHINITFLALRLMLAYKTQRVTWLGLGIFTLYNYLFGKFRLAQPRPIKYLDNCFYEFRGRASQKIVIKHLISLQM
jgi:hypothetical protein